MKYHFWKKKTQEQIKTTVFEALTENVNYKDENILGIPATFLDEKVFSQDEVFLKEAPFISALVQNSNHIGCHTLGTSEKYFKGTQAIEKELIEICAVDILKGEPGQFDGYVASGGTEANMQAIWMYRNYFINVLGAKREEICILCSEDSHYSVDKGSNLLVLDIYKVPVEKNTREVTSINVKKVVEEAKNHDKKYFIVFCNMMTTMFGSVDKVTNYSNVLEALNCEFKIHVDGAFGGFYHPFIEGETDLNFDNKLISSVTLDAHKMAQAPYGTGIFLSRKGLIGHVHTKQGYVTGEDCTMIGSRSGANAVAVWMILAKHGPFGWGEKIYVLQKRAQWMCEQLTELEIEYFREPRSNIITIKSEYVTEDIALEFGLVPDSHAKPNWFKIVIMEHVTIEKLMPLVEKLKNI